MSENKSGGTEGIGEQYLLLFGTIVQSFAAHELLIQRVVAHVLAAPASSVAVLMRPLTFEEKRKALLDLLRHHKVPLDQYDHVASYLNVPSIFAQLCDHIVHSTWDAAPPSRGLQPDWILKPASRIRPVSGVSDDSQIGLREGEDEKFAYSLDEFREIATTLQSNLAGFSNYLTDAGLIGKS